MARDIQRRGFEFAREVLIFCDLLIRHRGVCALIGRQLADAASAIGANLEEAAAGQTKRDFIAKTCIALKESREAHY